MLGSITPLGERGRSSRWGLTVAAFIVASAAAGALLGGALGALGAVAGVEPSAVTLGVLALALLVGLLFDLRVGGLRLPTVARQVDDRWLYRYRGWVTGLGFGLQLGLGVVTIVTTAFTYVAFVAALLSGSAASGLLIGGVYGSVRAATILAGSTVQTPEALIGMHERLRRWELHGRRGAVALQTLLLVTAVAVTAGHI